ncbi:hypothetical protein [Candidatus Uabimicrobium sp. HlEnr_7]|uniref:hypothetical protein n=1 Tax=Candidatus Uabimicrobium helgolandensis TaxID=3095367 RepID=UPI0035562DA7
MEKEIIIVFCICDEIKQALKIVEDPQVKMTNSEIMTTALITLSNILFLKLLMSLSYLRERKILKGFFRSY